MAGYRATGALLGLVVAVKMLAERSAADDDSARFTRRRLTQRVTT
jgi:hypothetical protein